MSTSNLLHIILTCETTQIDLLVEPTNTIAVIKKLVCDALGKEYDKWNVKILDSDKELVDTQALSDLNIQNDHQFNFSTETK